MRTPVKRESAKMMSCDGRDLQGTESLVLIRRRKRRVAFVQSWAATKRSSFVLPEIRIELRYYYNGESARTV